MADQETESLIGQGVKQGAYVPATALSPGLKSLISAGRAVPAKRSKEIVDTDLLVFLSQDCDISSPNEIHIELIVARKCRPRESRNNESLTRARNTRKLQFLHEGDWWECHVDLISTIAKAEILNDCDLTSLQQLPITVIEMLVTWRVNRYLRAPLPDKFNRIFVTGYLRSEGKELADFLEHNRESILDLYVYISPDEEDCSDYSVSITALVCHGCSDELFNGLSELMEKHLQILHAQNTCLSFMQIAPELITNSINHVMDYVVRPDSFTMQDIHAMKRLSVDYLCFPG